MISVGSNNNILVFFEDITGKMESGSFTEMCGERT